MQLMCSNHVCVTQLLNHPHVCVLASDLPAGEIQALAPLPIVQRTPKPEDKQALIVDVLGRLKQCDSRHDT